jgi:hypothetical protein
LRERLYTAMPPSGEGCLPSASISGQIRMHVLVTLVGAQSQGSMVWRVKYPLLACFVVGLSLEHTKIKFERTPNFPRFHGKTNELLSVEEFRPTFHTEPGRPIRDVFPIGGNLPGAAINPQMPLAVDENVTSA